MTDVRMPDNQKIRLCMGCMKQYDSRYDVCPYCGYFVQTPRRDASILEPGTILHGRYIAGKGSRHYDNDLHGIFGNGHTAMYIGWDCVEAKRVAIEEYFPANLAERTREGKLSLKEYFTTRRPMWEDQVLNLTLGVATALNRVHQMGIGLFEIRSLYHIRVLDPDNRDYPDVELYDFHDYVQGVYGDSFLNAPERFLKTEWKPQMDVYALAAISYLLLTGVQPPDSVSRVMEDSLKRPSELGISVSMAVEAALMHALCIRKEERTQTMDIFIKELTAGDEYEYNAVCEFAKNNNDLRVEKPDIGLQPGMKWYKFIIWFQLFATALVSLGTAVQYLMGLHYGENATLVYAFYRGMKILDLLMGIIMMSEAVFCIVVRQKLVKFRQGAPEMYLVIIAVNCFLPVVYLLMASLIMEVSFVNLLTASVIGSFIGTATMLALNVIYFRNRKEIFVN